MHKSAIMVYLAILQQVDECHYNAVCTYLTNCHYNCKQCVTYSHIKHVAKHFAHRLHSHNYMY